MASFLRSFGIKKSKHKKLPEEWSDCKQPVVEGITFYSKYLGSTLVEEPSNDKLTAEAIKRIIMMVKAKGKKVENVSITIKPTGISFSDMNTGQDLTCVSIYRISYCSADATYDRVIAFIATNANETHECHAFLTPKRKIAQAIALTISQAFNIAFEKWKTVKAANESDKEQNGKQLKEEKQGSGNANEIPPLIDLSGDENAPSAANIDDSWWTLAESAKNVNGEKSSANVVAFDDFHQLSRFVKKEMKESKKSDKFFANDDLFSL